MLALNQKSKKKIEHDIGIKFEDLINMDFDEIERLIEKKTGKKIAFSSSDDIILNRGNPYLALKRYLTEAFLRKRLAKI